MALERGSKVLFTCRQCSRHTRTAVSTRTFTTTAPAQLETETQSSTEAPPPPPSGNTASESLNPFNVVSARAERRLVRDHRQVPIGSRRRRAAIQSTASIPFAELPYQCFQEARKFLQDDRVEKLEQIRVQRERIERAKSANVAPQDEARTEKKVRDMSTRLEHLKILADVNDPLVKKKFEDGQGDMNKPIYRYLADRQWRSYKRALLLQRIEQMNVIPDVLPAIDPTVSTTLSFGPRKVQYGDFVESRVSEHAPTLNIQCYDKGTRLVTIAVINPDVPNVEKDGFDYRCHFLASNVEVSPTETRINLGRLDPSSQVIIPWLPAYAQKGAPYQRMSIFVLQQPKSDTVGSQTVDTAAIKEAGRYSQREGLKLRSFVDKFLMKPVGVDLFRTKWDEGTAGVMQRAGVVGSDVEFRRKRIEPLPYQRRNGERYR